MATESIHFFLLNMKVNTDRDINGVEQFVRVLVGNPITNSALDVSASLTVVQQQTKLRAVIKL